jgi:hypothetical protein
MAAEAHTPSRPATNVRPPGNRERGVKEIGAGLLMILLGVLITVGTFSMHLPIFLVSWGPVVFGFVRVFRGQKLLTFG